MKAATFDTVHVSDVSSGTSLTGMFRKTGDILSAWHKRRLAIRELNTLSDRQLADIGLMRADIPSTIEKLMK